MFKKASDVRQQQKLSGADRKKLRRTLQAKFASVSDADLDALLPPKVDVAVSRLANRALVYTVSGGPPLLFDSDGRGHDIFPTVYALWRLPALLPAFVLKGDEVSRYVLGGADLMLPGIAVPAGGLPAFEAGEIWAVRVPDNPFPIAVGSTATSSAQAAAASMRGKALHITHHYRDTLWEGAEGKYVPNAGFEDDIVRADPSPGEPGGDAAATAAPSSQEPHSSSPPAAPRGPHEDISGEHPSGPPADGENGGADSALEGASRGVGTLAVGEPEGGDGEGGGGGEGGASRATPEEMDALLDQCLLQALKTSVKDSLLPLAGSNLWSHHVLPSRPPGVVVDLKKSTHKKLSKWLQAKAGTQLIAAREDKHKKEIVLLAVNRSHPNYVTFRPAAAAAQAGSPQAAVSVTEVWKPSSQVLPIFEAVGADTSAFYGAQEATDVAAAYVAAEGLVKPADPAAVVLDARLCDALFKGAVKKGAAYPTEIHRKDLGPLFLGRMAAHHRVARGGDVAVRKGALQKVHIITSRRQGNKKVTLVTGMESFLVPADALAAELQKKFACSTSVGEVPGKKDQHEVLVQGGVPETLGHYLVEHYGVPKKYIEIMDKTKR